MRLLLLNQTFYPDVAATAQHADDLARHMTRQGHKVIAITSRSLYGQSGAALPRRENLEGVEIHRVGFSLFGKGGTLSRLIDFALFYVAAGWRVLTLPRVDVIVPFTTPPLIVGVGWLARKLRGIPYVYWVMDLYPDLAAASGVMRPRGLVHRLCERISRACIRSAARVVVLGRCMRERLLDKGVPPEKVAVINVWADQNEVIPRDAGQREANPKRAAWGLTGRFAVMYSGNLGLGHDTRTLCDAMLRLRDRDDIRFIFIGGGKRLAEVRAFVQENGLANARFEPYQPREDLSDTLTAGDAHLISQKAELTGMLVPSKLFGILAAQRPVLFVGDRAAEVGRVIEEHECGYIIPEGDGAGLAQAIVNLADQPAAAEAMGRRGRTALENQYDRALACAAWERLLERVVQQQTTAQPAPESEA